MSLNTIHKTTLTALCLLSLSPALLFAGSGPKPIEERGIIKSVDMSAHTLVVTEQHKKNEQKFQWNDQTKFSQHNKSVDPSALKEGERVELTYSSGGTTPTLQSVRIDNTAKHNASKVSRVRS